MKKKLIWLVLTLALVTTAGGMAYFWTLGRPQILRLSGTVEIQEVRLGSKLGGRVKEVLAKEGKIAEPGEVLVIFEVPELETQRDQLRAKLRQAEADLEKTVNGPRIEEKQAGLAATAAAKARYEKVKNGPREEEKKQAKGDLDTARADFKQSELDLERSLPLFQQKAISRADLDASQASHDRNRGRLKSLEARYDLLLKGSRPEEIAEALAQYEQAEAQSDQLEAGSRPEDIEQAYARVQEAEAHLAESEVNLREAKVVAPESCIIDVVSVRRGDVIPPNQSVIKVLLTGDVWVKVFVPETKLGGVSVGQQVDVFTDSFPDTPLKGTIRFIDPISEFTPRNIQSIDERRHQVFGIKVFVDNASNTLRAGMAAYVDIAVKTSP